MPAALAASFRSPWDLVLVPLIGTRDPGRVLLIRIRAPGRVGMADTARRDSLARLRQGFRPRLLLREPAGPREIGREPFAYERTSASNSKP